MAIRNSVMHCYQVCKNFTRVVKFSNVIAEEVYKQGEIFTTKQINDGVKLLEKDGFIKFKQKLVW